MAPADPLLRLINVTKRFAGVGDASVSVLAGIDLTVERGESLAIVGPSGSGKSTLLNMIGGMDRPTSGRILFGEQDLTHASERQLTLFRRHQIGFVFQFFNLVPTLTALENVQVAVDLARQPLEAGEALRVVGLEDRAGHFPSQLSGGEQQRVAIARALINDPIILLADEPTGNLDPDSSWDIMQILSKVNSRGTTVLVASHNQQMVDVMQKRVLVMERGVMLHDLERGRYIPTGAARPSLVVGGV